MSRSCYECYWKAQVNLAALMGTCVTRKVGSVMVRDKRQVATGFNGNLPGHRHCDDGGCARCKDTSMESGQGLGICLCCHAEENLISYCARAGVRTNGTTVFCSYSPCLGCFRLMCLSGVREVVYGEPYPTTLDLVSELADLSGVMLRPFSCSCEVSVEVSRTS